jgi:hypothetical protein
MAAAMMKRSGGCSKEFGYERVGQDAGPLAVFLIIT